MDENNSPRLTDIAYVKALMERHGRRFEKRYGQNFLVNPDVPRRIAEECGVSQESGILEIGPGVGALTVCLAKRYAKVVAVELDRGLLPILDETLSGYGNVKIINADVLKLDLAAVISEYFPGMDVSVCANLPYYITTPVIIKLLESGVRFDAITLMVQREFFVRLNAKPGTPEYSATTAEVAWFCNVKRLFDVSPGNFIPAPKVVSSVIRLEPRTEPIKAVSHAAFKRVVAAAFSSRRKTLCNALSAGRDKAETADLLRQIDIDPDRRGETLGLDELIAVTQAFERDREYDNK